MNSLIVSATESAAFANGSKSAFVVPVKPQPVFKCGVGHWYKGAIMQEVGEEQVVLDYIEKHGPYKIGQKIYLREPVAFVHHWYSTYPEDEDGALYRHDDMVHYMTDGPYKVLGKNEWGVEIGASATNGFLPHSNGRFWRRVPMPFAAARHWVTPVKCEVVKCRDMSEEQAKGLGISSSSKDGGRTIKFGIPDKDGYPGGIDIGWPWSEYQNNYLDAVRKLMTAKHGQSFWDNNGVLFYYTTEMSEK